MNKPLYLIASALFFAVSIYVVKVDHVLTINYILYFVFMTMGWIAFWRGF